MADKNTLNNRSMEMLQRTLDEIKSSGITPVISVSLTDMPASVQGRHSGVASFITIDEQIQQNRGCYFLHTCCAL